MKLEHLFTPKPAVDQAAEELARAKRELLNAHTLREHHLVGVSAADAHIAVLVRRIARLQGTLDDA